MDNNHIEVSIEDKNQTAKLPNKEYEQRDKLEQQKQKIEEKRLLEQIKNRINTDDLLNGEVTEQLEAEKVQLIKNTQQLNDDLKKTEELLKEYEQLDISKSFLFAKASVSSMILSSKGTLISSSFRPAKNKMLFTMSVSAFSSMISSFFILLKSFEFWLIIAVAVCVLSTSNL